MNPLFALRQKTQGSVGAHMLTPLLLKNIQLTLVDIFTHRLIYAYDIKIRQGLKLIINFVCSDFGNSLTLNVLSRSHQISHICIFSDPQFVSLICLYSNL